MKSVLLTGANGFVGRHCVTPLLRHGYEVHATSSKAVGPGSTMSRVHTHLVDLLDKNQVSVLLAQIRPTHLLHCAWYAEPGKYWTSNENFAWVTASRHLLETFATGGGQRAVAVGSCAEYDWEQGYCSESITPLRPATTYGSCKHTLNLEIEKLSSQTGLSTAWGRIFFLYGPHEHPDRLVASVIRSLLRGEEALCSHGQQTRDFLHVEDAGDALVALLNSDVNGAVNIASGVPITVREVVETIGKQLHRLDLVKLGRRPAANEPQLIVADTTRLRDEVGWSPQYDLATGLSQTIDWWKTQQQK